jgi:hypothetical protein
MEELFKAILKIIEQEPLFGMTAFVGTALFLVQMLLNLMGGEDDGDHGDDHFKWLSKQTVMGFVMMFGWAGLTCKREFEFPPLLSLSIATGSGVVTFFVTGVIFKLVKKLTSPGTVFRIEEALGKEGVVYHRIPKDGTGKVSVSLHDHLHEIDAVTPIHKEIAAFTHIKVVSIEDEKTVSVVPLKGVKT